MLQTGARRRLTTPGKLAFLSRSLLALLVTFAPTVPTCTEATVEESVSRNPARKLLDQQVQVKEQKRNQRDDANKEVFEATKLENGFQQTIEAITQVAASLFREGRASETKQVAEKEGYWIGAMRSARRALLVDSSTLWWRNKAQRRINARGTRASIRQHSTLAELKVQHGLEELLNTTFTQGDEHVQSGIAGFYRDPDRFNQQRPRVKRLRAFNNPPL